MSMLSYYDPSLCALHRCLSDSMSLEKLFVCYHLPTRDEQELSLGMLIRCKRIYHFIQYLAFSGTNLITRCHSVSSCFLLFLYFIKFVHEIFSELYGTN